LKIHSKFPDQQTTIFSVMSALAARYGAINLSQGFPNYQPDPVLTGMVTEAMAGPFNQYAPMPGHPALRAVLAEKHSAATGRHLEADSEITITAGATQALFTAIAALVRPGDEVLYFEPAYDSYRPAIIANSATPVAISLSAPDFTIDWEQVATHINGRTRMIIVNTPNNPGCYCWTDEDWTQLESLVEGRDIAVLSDEVYEHVLTGVMPHHSILSRPALADKGLAVFSFGKNFHMTGWKIGYIVAAEALTVEFRKLHQYLVFSVHHPTSDICASPTHTGKSTTASWRHAATRPFASWRHRAPISYSPTTATSASCPIETLRNGSLANTASRAYPSPHSTHSPPDTNGLCGSASPKRMNCWTKPVPACQPSEQKADHTGLFSKNSLISCSEYPGILNRKSGNKGIQAPA